MAKIWGPDAENWDEAEQAYVKYHHTGMSDDTACARDDDVTAAEQAPTLAEAGTEIDDANRGEHPYPTGTDQHTDPISQPDNSERAPEAVGETVDVLRQKVADLETANARLEARDAERDKVMAEQKTENAQLGKTVAEIKAENVDLRYGMTALEARVERVEQNSTDKPASKIVDRAHGGPEAKNERPDHEQKRRLPSDEALLFGAVGIGGAVTTASYYLSFVRPDVAGITASLLATGAAGVAWVHKRREARHADRQKD